MRAVRNLLGWIVWALLVAGATLAIGVIWFPQLPVRQPLAFNHAKHKKMACVVCHRGVETRAYATIPDMNTCLNCHAAPPVKDATAIAIWNAAAMAKHIGWQRITRIPDHVYFSHRRHVDLAQLDCAACHGDMADRTTPPAHPLTRISMNNCLDCHRQQSASTDCARCHK